MTSPEADLGRAVVLVLTMERQWRATRLTLASIHRQLPAGARCVLLLNGSTAPAITDECAARFPFVTLYTSAANLGVAGGRNFLLGTEEARGAEYVFHLDNDVLLPEGYFAALGAWLERLPDAGIVGPLVFAAHPILTFLHETQGGLPVAPFTSAEVVDSWRASGVPEPWHFGSHPDWFATYCSNRTLVRRWLARRVPGVAPPPPAHNRDDPALLAAIAAGTGPLPVSNLAGCGTLYQRRLVDELGGYDDRFNPYHLEDADLAIRARRAGYVNYLCPAVALLHGTDVRAGGARAYARTLEHWIRGEALLRRKHVDAGLPRLAALLGYGALTLGAASLRALRAAPLAPLTDALAGLHAGLTLPEPGSRSRGAP